MTFGDITFTKPGTYTYSLSEITPSSGALRGFNYSRAQYVVTVTVAVEDGNVLWWPASRRSEHMTIPAPP